MADPDLQIRWGAGGGEGVGSGRGGESGHLDPEIRGRRSQKIFFGPSGLSLV